MLDGRRAGPNSTCKSRPISDLRVFLHRYEDTDVSWSVSRISRLGRYGDRTYGGLICQPLR